MKYKILLEKIKKAYLKLFFLVKKSSLMPFSPLFYVKPLYADVLHDVIDKMLEPLDNLLYGNL